MITDGGQSATNRQRHPRRRRYLFACGGAAVLLLTAATLVLALVVFKPRQLDTELQSAVVQGVSPRVTFPEIHVELNVTLALDFLVRNPNRAGFNHAAGKAAIFYRGRQVGDADVAPGSIPSRGSAHLFVRLTVEADRFMVDTPGLVQDVMAGRLELDSSTRIPGHVTFLGFVRRHVVVFTDCQVIVSFPPIHVSSQHCRQRTD